MIIYYMDEDAYNYLTDWSEEHKTATRFCSEYDKKSKVILKDYNKELGMELTLYVQRVKEHYKYSFLNENGIIIKGRLLPQHNDDSDFRLTLMIVNELEDEVMKKCIYALKVYVTAFVCANCFMWYGNLAESKEYTAAGKNENNGNKLITFRKYKDTIYAVPFGSHKSPEGVFSVRGHFRKYQNGKVVWIDSYLKGQE